MRGWAWCGSPGGGFVLAVLQVAIQHHIHHPSTIFRALSGSVGTVRCVPGARLHLDLLGVGDQKQAVGQKGQLRQDALELVVDERVSLP